MPLLLFLLPWGCSDHDGGNSQEEEEAIFAMVNDPGAEGLYDVVVGRADSLLLRARMSDTLRGYVMIEKGWRSTTGAVSLRPWLSPTRW